MGNDIGRQVLGTIGHSIALAASDDADFKVGGVTADWANIAAQSGSDATFADGVVVAVGEKALPLGTVLYKHASGLYRVADNTTTLVAGETYLVNKTVKEEDVKSNFPEVLFGGSVWKELLRVGGGAQPTLAALLAVCPRLQLIST